jgi:hypothetical protein
MTPLTNEELAEIEKRHRNTQNYYDDLKEGSGEPLSATGPQVHQDRAALLAHIRSQTPPQAVTDQVERRDDLHSVIARIMKQPVYNSSQISDAVEQYLDRLSASPTAQENER